jgi:hypothetical protein
VAAVNGRPTRGTDLFSEISYLQQVLELNATHVELLSRRVFAEQMAAVRKEHEIKLGQALAVVAKVIFYTAERGSRNVSIGALTTYYDATNPPDRSAPNVDDGYCLSSTLFRIYHTRFHEQLDHDREHHATNRGATGVLKTIKVSFDNQLQMHTNFKKLGAFLIGEGCVLQYQEGKVRAHEREGNQELLTTITHNIDTHLHLATMFADDQVNALVDVLSQQATLSMLIWDLRAKGFQVHFFASTKTPQGLQINLWKDPSPFQSKASALSGGYLEFLRENIHDDSSLVE